ncbi:MAG: porin [Comamonadaceae bacterium]|nr:porin [Comamonadaceae bacterium]
MKKTVIAALALCGAGAALAQSQPAAPAAPANTSKVQLSGVVDVAYRHTTNEGADQGGLNRMVGGGMSQSRLEFTIEEDMGSGTKALAYLEHRLNADSGEKDIKPVPAPFFQLSYVGLQGPYGRLTMGRQWNVLFDVVTSTYASFPYSPYMDAYKPELGMAMGARTSNSLKYVIANADRSLAAGLQYSFGENNEVKDKPLIDLLKPGAKEELVSQLQGPIQNYGGFVRYSKDGISVGGGYMNFKLPGGTKVDAFTLGGSYKVGALYLNAGYGQNKVKNPFNATVPSMADAVLLSTYWSGQTNGGFMPGPTIYDFDSGTLQPQNVGQVGNSASKREMFKIGFGYQVTPQINAGAHYFHAKQSGSANGVYNGNANFFVTALDYAFSKRTDAYAALDYTKVSGGDGMTIDKFGARSRTGFTVGLRHRF